MTESLFGGQLPDFLTSALHDWSLSVTAYFLRPDHDSGTAYLKMFSHPRPCHW